MPQHRAASVRRHGAHDQRRAAHSAPSRSGVTDSVSGSVTSGRYTTLARRDAHVVDERSDRAPTVARRGRRGPDARPAPCPSCRRRVRQSSPSGPRSQSPFSARPQTREVAAMSEEDEHRRGTRRDDRRGRGCRWRRRSTGSATVATTEPSETYFVRPHGQQKDQQRRQRPRSASARRRRRTPSQRLFLP